MVNAYGTIEGLITLHDILENLTGDIPEEGEKTEADIFIWYDQYCLLSGYATAEVIGQIIEKHITDYEHIDYSTVAGLELYHIAKIPQIGDKFLFNDHVWKLWISTATESARSLSKKIKPQKTKTLTRKKIQ